PSLGVDQLDRPLRGQAWWYPLLEEEAEEVAVARADLFADDHLDAERGMLGGERARLERAADLVVVGDGDDVRPAGRRLDDHVGMLGAVAPDGMDVEIGAARKRRGAPARSRERPPERAPWLRGRRSEERRVGKEGRSRWAPGREKRR